MGIIISRFRRKKSTLDILDDLDKRIRGMEAQGKNVQQRCQRVTTGLFLYTVGLYVISVFIWYWYWPPLNTNQQLYRLPVLLVSAISIFLLRKTVRYYYTYKIKRNDKKLVEMRDKKKQILEEVMDQETFKVAKTILEKFAPENLGGKVTYSLAPLTSMTPNKQPALTPGITGVSGEIRHRTIQSSIGQTPQLPMTRASVNNPDFRPNMQLARPVQPHERTFLDRLLEFIIGDGPSNRYALICKSCMCHNGLALKEEFEYLPFRCYNCHQWNPARKQRPQAPKLEDSPSSSLFHKDNTGALLSPDTLHVSPSSSSDSEDELDNIGNFEKSTDTKNENAEVESERVKAEADEETSSNHDNSHSENATSELNTSQEREKETSVSEPTESLGSEEVLGDEK